MIRAGDVYAGPRALQQFHSTDPIGEQLVLLAVDQIDRFKVRFSGAGFETDCSAVHDTAETITGIRCPAETDAARSCATCGLCWQTNRTINFVRH